MDPRQTQPYSSSNNTSQGSTNYALNGTQSDPFHAFVNADEGPAFDSSWGSQAFPHQQSSIGGFDHAHQGWQADPYQSSNQIQIANYGIQQRDFDQTFSRSPASFNYPAFGQDQSQPFAAPAFDTSLGYGHMHINDRFEFPGSNNFGQRNETISPQALQAYPQGTQSTVQPLRVPQPQSYGPSPSVQGGGSYQQSLPANQPLSHQEWITLCNPKTTSISRSGLHIKPTDAYAKATNSARIDGFIFVGNNNLKLNTLQTPVQRHKRRKSRSEVSRLLQLERGEDRPHPERGPILKRLKTAAIKLAGPAPASSPNVSNAESGSDSSESESDNDSGYSNSDLDIEPEEPSPVPLARPVDPNKAIEYDIIKTVWAKKRAVLSGTVIRTALTECWNIFIRVRDNWKKKNASLQDAIEKKDTANKSTYERRVTEQRRLLESCVRLTLQHGHPSIIVKLGENPKLLVVFYVFLADRIKEADYTGGFVNSILELTARCVSIDSSLLEQTKMDKVLPRFVKRGDEQGKLWAQRILENATKAKAQKGSSTESVAGVSSTLNGAPSDKQMRTAVVETSKPRTGTGKEHLTGDSNKSTKLPLTSKAGVPKGESDSVKSKNIPTATKPSGFFAGLQSASKRPGTSHKAKDGRSSDTDAASEESKAAPKPAFSFAATMANLQKQKEAPPPKPENVPKPETAEEKRKRLRKEERRKLRVSFKADGDLVQIREFVHDPDEEMGHEDSQMRDVGDSKGEGQMLRMHKDLDLMDEDEDYEPPEEIEPLPDWTSPQLTDFSEIEHEERERNYITRGGHLQPDTQESKVQEQRDLSMLMVVYTSNSDIPPSPKEPAVEDSQMRVEESKFGDPLPSTKARESEYRAKSYAPAMPVTQPTADIGAILARVNGQQKAQPVPVQPQQPAAPAPALAGLQALLAQIGGNNNGQQQPPAFPIAQQQPPAATFNLATTLAKMAPTQQSYQPQPSHGTATPGQVDLQAILAQINGTQPRLAQASAAPGFNFNQNPNTLPIDSDRKRQFDGNEQDEYGKSKKMRGDNAKIKKPVYNEKTLPCKFWQEGKCRKGDDCTFIHD